jgi:hypothetical protein
MNRLARDHSGKVYAAPNIDCEVDFCDYIIVNGIRFNRDSNMNAIHRVDFEPEERFAVLPAYLEH